ncbi:hypothetical protein BEH61_15530 (plasmid) [Clavibacter michiganensis subsp. insidiosus]|nr:hypothetical protein BEH61_15530 [Clavibacter michiganensis subsp. insidiosus]
MAARAEVSIKTVSNVIVGHAFVRPETRDRVQQAVEELRYRPNAMARYLRLGTIHAIGLVLPDLQEPRYAAFADSVVTTATGRGLIVFIHTTRDPSATDSAALMTTSHDLARGFILCTDLADPYAPDLTWRPRPRIVVNLGGSARTIEADDRRALQAPSHLAALDPSTAGREAVEALASLLPPQPLRG